MEWQAWKESLCSGCGHPLYETMADRPPDGSPLTPKQWANRYQVDVHTCAACEVRGHKSWALNKNHDSKHPPASGRYLTVHLAEEVSRGRPE